MGAWLLLSLIVATALFLLWALPIWRDLSVLRNATQLIGQETWAPACACPA